MYNPQAVEDSVWGINDEVITFCVEVPEGAVIKGDLSAVGFLRKVRNTYQNWVAYGTAIPSSSPGLSHNVSNTVHVGDDEWEEVIEFIYDNRECFSGIALIPKRGDKVYRQAPNEKIISTDDAHKWNELVSKYEKIDWTKFQELEDYTSLRETVACSGGTCEF